MRVAKMTDLKKKGSRWAWTNGRQNFYYQKLKLFSLFRFDCYLIRYGFGTAIGWHTDDVEGYRHYRFNIQLRGKNRMEFCGGKLLNLWRIAIFRSDKLHCMDITKEKGLILSFGVILRNRENKL